MICAGMGAWMSVSQRRHTHRAYIWSYGSTQFDAAPLVVYDFTESRGGHHARAFLSGWQE